MSSLKKTKTNKQQCYIYFEKLGFAFKVRTGCYYWSHCFSWQDPSYCASESPYYSSSHPNPNQSHTLCINLTNLTNEGNQSEAPYGGFCRKEAVGSVIKRMGVQCVPSDKECCVMVRGMAVILDILTLLPDTEVVKSRGSIEAHCRSFLFWMKHSGCDQKMQG